MEPAREKSEVVTSVAITVHWAEQGGLLIMAGERIIKAVETEEQLALFIGGFLKAARGTAKHITIPIEDHNRLLEYRDQVRRMSRGETQAMAKRLSPHDDPPTTPVEDEEPQQLGRFRSIWGGRS